MPEVVKRKLIGYALPQKSIWTAEDEFNQRPLTRQERKQFEMPAPEPPREEDPEA